MTSRDLLLYFRPLWYDHPADTSLYTNQVEFLLGDSLLSSPVLESNEKSHVVTLPAPHVRMNAIKYFINTMNYIINTMKYFINNMKYFINTINIL